MASDKAGNSNSSRRSPGDATSPGDTTQPGDTRNRSTRLTRTNKPPAYLGSYVCNVKARSKSWESKPNPVNPPGILIKPLRTTGFDFLPWEPQYPKDKTAKLANFCTYFWPESRNSTFYHENMLGRTDRTLRDDRQQTNSLNSHFCQSSDDDSDDETDDCMCNDYELFCCYICRKGSQIGGGGEVSTVHQGLRWRSRFTSPLYPEAPLPLLQELPTRAHQGRCRVRCRVCEAVQARAKRTWSQAPLYCSYSSRAGTRPS